MQKYDITTKQRDSKGRFVKGHKALCPFPKGYKSPFSWNGKEFTEVQRQNMSKSHIGKKHTEEQKRKIGLAAVGRVFSEESRKKISESNKGEKHYKWKGGVSKSPYYQANYQKTYRKKWREKNIEKARFYVKSRRARYYAAEGSHTISDWETLKAQYNWTCPACKKTEPEIKLTEDHIIPLIKGGSHNIENIQPLCKPCNSRKRDKLVPKYE